MMAFKKNIQKNGSSVELHEFHSNAVLNMQENTASVLPRWTNGQTDTVEAKKH